MRKAKPVVGLVKSNKSRPKSANTRRPSQAQNKKVTRKKLRDMNAASFQGQSFDDKKKKTSKKFNKGDGNQSSKGKKKLTKGEKARKKLSQKLLKS